MMPNETANAPLQVSFSLTNDDLAAFKKIAADRRKAKSSRMSRWLYLLAIVPLVTLLIAKEWQSRQGHAVPHYVRHYTKSPDIFNFLMPVGTVLLILGLFYFLMQAQMKASMNQPDWFYQPKMVTISGEGYREKSKATELLHGWEMITEIADAPGYLLFFISGADKTEIAFLVPKYAFATATEATTFLERARAFRRAVRAESVTA